MEEVLKNEILNDEINEALKEDNTEDTENLKKENLQLRCENYLFNQGIEDTNILNLISYKDFQDFNDKFIRITNYYENLTNTKILNLEEVKNNYTDKRDKIKNIQSTLKNIFKHPGL